MISSPCRFRGLQRPLWNLRIPYAARYNYQEELVIGSVVGSQNPVAEKLMTAYHRVAVHLAALAGDGERVKGAFASEIAAEFPTCPRKRGRWHRRCRRVGLSARKRQRL